MRKTADVTTASQADHLWVFGYGSILWKTGFRYSRRRLGYIQGYVRRFWQGNTTHRGTPEAPGRVATLVEDKEGVAWGAAYELKGSKMVRDALEHLGMRECTLGGYDVEMVTFKDRHHSDSITVLVFSATPSNSLYMGPAEVDELANQIVACKGESGHNVEYVTRLADFVREFIPEDRDEHLFGLDMLIRTLLLKKDICLHSLQSTQINRRCSYSYVHTDVLRTHSGCQETTGLSPVLLRTIGELFVTAGRLGPGA